MQLPTAPEKYDAKDQATMRGILQREDNRNQKKDGDKILTAPNGSRWKLVVDNAGTVSAVAA